MMNQEVQSTTTTDAVPTASGPVAEDKPKNQSQSTRRNFGLKRMRKTIDNVKNI